VREWPQYNYPEFLAEPNDADWEPFLNGLRVGDRAPDFAAIRLDDGATARLGDYTARANVVLEFGSLT
jgi:hypothetical protein